MLKSHYFTDLIEAGCDEAGRGCLAGSVFAAAVILPTDYENALLNDSKKLTLPHETIVKGDAKYLSIAAASILAKTYRDDYMDNLALQYPAYQWKVNKGYPTKAHRAAIEEHGISPFHRKTFKGVKEMLVNEEECV